MTGLIVSINGKVAPLCLFVFSRTFFRFSLGHMYQRKPNWTVPSPVTAVRYKKLERYLFHNISL